MQNYESSLQKFYKPSSVFSLYFFIISSSSLPYLIILKYMNDVINVKHVKVTNDSS